MLTTLMTLLEFGNKIYRLVYNELIAGKRSH